MYWNPCEKDGLPEDGSEVLVYTTEGDFFLTHFFEEIGFVEKHKGISKILHRHGYTPRIENVTHWKELVVPLVEEDDEDDLESIS